MVASNGTKKVQDRTVEDIETYSTCSQTNAQTTAFDRLGRKERVISYTDSHDGEEKMQVDARREVPYR